MELRLFNIKMVDTADQLAWFKTFDKLEIDLGKDDRTNPKDRDHQYNQLRIVAHDGITTNSDTRQFWDPLCSV